MRRSATIPCVLFLVVVSLVSSCRTPATTTTESTVIEQRKDSVIIKEVERVVRVEVPGDSIPYAVQIECDKKTNKPKPMKYSGKSGRATNVMTIDSLGWLRGTAGCEALVKMMAVKDKEITYLKEYIRKEKSKETIPVFKTRKIDIIARWIAGLAILFIVLRIKKLI